MVKENKFFLRAKRRRDGFHKKQTPFRKPSSRPPGLSENITSILSQALGSKKDGKTKVTLHLGPANSGKTYDAIETLKNSSSGIYLAPLRLLAWEVADKLNQQGYPCSLLTGEEKVIIPDAPFMSSTVEMFRSDFQGECIVLDESQMLADDQRGWAWMRVLVMGRVNKLEIIASPDSERLMSKILRKLGYHFTVSRHERLSPLTIATKPWRIDQPEEHTIFVVFSRAGVLNLKTYFERRGWTVAAIYGNLPPEVKKTQAERFINGDAKLCVATDAIGMGMNLPAAKVCFTSMVKYDGQIQRKLTTAEAMQIAGRAGRYGIKESGEAGALTHENVKILNHLLSLKPPDLEFARVSIELSDIKKMNGSLLHRLETWEKYAAIPSELKDVILPADLEQQKSLAGFIKEEEINQLGFEAALTLIKAPASRESFSYWWACVKSILDNRPLPLPLSLSQGNPYHEDTLLNTENIVEQCDIYLWLSNRVELSQFGLQKEKVTKYKWDLIEKIDRTLTAKNDLQQKCRKCGNKLPVLHSYSICDSCFRSGRRRFFSRPKHRKFRFH